MTDQELFTYYETAVLPEGRIQPFKHVIIDDPKYFVDSQLYMIRESPRSPGSDSCRIRLIEFKEWVENKN